MPLAVQVQSTEVICFGKLPTHGDFVRHNAHTGAVRALDEWLQRGMYFAKEHGTRRAVTDAEAGPVHFVFASPNQPKALAGVIHPSRDRVGRRYPFLVAAELERNRAEVRSAAQLPLNLNGFLEWAGKLAQDAVSGQVDYRDLARHVEQSSPPSRQQSGAAADGEAYLRQTTLRLFSERLWGAFEDSRKYRLFKNLLDILLPLEHNLPASFPLGLRFPLCQGCSSAPGDVSFWLDVSWHLLKLPFATPSFFWTPEAEGRSVERPYLLMFLRQPAPSALAYLLADVADHEHVCDLEHMGRQSAADIALSIPVRYGRLLENDDLSLRDFLNGL